MARSRNIKPALFKNEILGEADPLLTILFIGLWSLADREGRLEDRPKRIKAEIFPYRECHDFNGYLTELERLGFISRYSVSEVDVIQVLNFKKHQSPHKTEKDSDLPEMPATQGFQGGTVKAPLNNGSVTDEAALIPDSLNTDSLSKSADESAYAFEGETVKLSPADYQRCLTQYPNIDLDYHLAQLDLELREEKKWFMPLHSKLNYRNKTETYHNKGQGEDFGV